MGCIFELCSVQIDAQEVHDTVPLLYRNGFKIYFLMACGTPENFE